MEALRAAELGDGVQHEPGHEYRKQAQRLLERFGHEVDFARPDGMIAADTPQGGRFTQGDIERGSCEGSPNVESRKAGHMEGLRQADRGEGLDGTGGAAAARATKAGAAIAERA